MTTQPTTQPATHRPVGEHAPPPLSSGEENRGGVSCPAEEENRRHPPAILLLGPTASGKTQLAFDIVSRFPCEIVSVDSAQVFRDMDIGTAKPDAATLARFPHRLIDLITPEESYSAARFREDALREMAAITAAGRIPLLVGGTLLYVKALREGLAELPAANPAVRAELDREAARHGWPALHARLATLDPVSAARLAPNDAQRIQRALEVMLLTGRPLSELHARPAGAALPYNTLVIALEAADRDELHRRIAERFGRMLEAGLIEEVTSLRQRYRLHAELPAMRCVGYRQVWQMLEGELPAGELHQRGIYATRQLAKRQLTWLRGMSDCLRLDAFDPQTPGAAVTAIARHIAPATRSG